MSSLDLKLSDPIGLSLSDKTLDVLRDFLQPKTALTLKSNARSILDLLPEKGPLSSDIWLVWDVCFELAVQIPYYHPSQLKLAALLEYLGKSTQLGQTLASKDMITGQYHWFQVLEGSLRRLTDSQPDPEDPSEHINSHAFAANLFKRRIFTTDISWAIWALRDAHENPQDEKGRIRDGHVSAAAQWILWYGQSFFKHVLFPGEVSSDDLRSWSPGPLYHGEAHLSLHRWHFWRGRFSAVVSGKTGWEKWYSQECKTLAAKAAEMMDSLEKNMTFEDSD